MESNQQGVTGEGGGGKGDGGSSGGGLAPGGGGQPGVQDAIASPLALASPDELRTLQPADALLFIQQQWRAERDRADAAQREAQELRAELARTQATLDESRAALDHAERRHQIDLMLIEQESIDLETSRLLTELAVSEMSTKDVAAAVSDLKRRKPFLFRTRPSRAGGAMSPAGAPADPLFEAASDARTGDRAALLRYLRVRRGA